MKSNAALWEKYDQDQLIDDLKVLPIEQLLDKYKTSRPSIRTACRKLSIPLDSRLFGKKLKHQIPDKDVLIDQLKQGKQHTAQVFNCSIPVVNSWIKKHNIDLEPYYGVKAGLDKNLILDLISQGLSDRDIAKQVNVSFATIERFASRHNVTVHKKGISWKDVDQKLEDNFTWICEQNQTRTILDISIELGISASKILKFLDSKGFDIISHSSNKSKGELEVKDFISSLGVSCQSVKRKFNDKIFELDIFVQDKMFAIEYCGEYWHSDDQKPKMYHYQKYQWCKDQGIRLFTMFDYQWKYKKEIIKSMIKARLGLAKKIHARQTIVKDISADEAKTFYEENHLQGYTPSTIHKGLFFENELVAAMSIVKSRFRKDEEWEMSRLAFKLHHVIVGGASKLLKQFKDYSMISYADLCIGDGQVYEKMGFIRLKNTTPNYFYFHKYSGIIHSRMTCQKKNLNNILSSFNPILTEYENMSNNGYLRVWTCGNAIFQRKL